MQTTAPTKTPHAATAANNIEGQQNITAIQGRWTSAPIRLSVSLKRLLVSQFTPDALRQLAAVIEYESPGMVARRRLNETGVNALADILVTGKKPTVGWWLRNGGGES